MGNLVTVYIKVHDIPYSYYGHPNLQIDPNNPNNYIDSYKFTSAIDSSIVYTINIVLTKSGNLYTPSATFTSPFWLDSLYGDNYYCGEVQYINTVKISQLTQDVFPVGKSCPIEK